MPSYDNTFRKQAVDLLIETGKPATEVALELGISPSTLRDWRDRRILNSKPGEISGPENMENADAAKLLRENKRLQREIQYLRTQREILKKAMSILGEDPQPGMH